MRGSEATSVALACMKAGEVVPQRVKLVANAKLSTKSPLQLPFLVPVFLAVVTCSSPEHANAVASTLFAPDPSRYCPVSIGACVWPR